MDKIKNRCSNCYINIHSWQAGSSDLFAHLFFHQHDYNVWIILLHIMSPSFGKSPHNFTCREYNHSCSQAVAKNKPFPHSCWISNSQTLPERCQGGAVGWEPQARRQNDINAGLNLWNIWGLCQCNTESWVNNKSLNMHNRWACLYSSDRNWEMTQLPGRGSARANCTHCKKTVK